MTVTLGPERCRCCRSLLFDRPPPFCATCTTIIATDPTLFLEKDIDI